MFEKLRVFFEVLLPGFTCHIQFVASTREYDKPTGCFANAQIPPAGVHVHVQLPGDFLRRPCLIAENLIPIEMFLKLHDSSPIVTLR